MNGQSFIRIIHEAFCPFLKGLGFMLEASLISGRFYRAKFISKSNVIDISYEPGDDAFFVIIFNRFINGQLSDVDNRRETPRLVDLNNQYMATITSEERAKNEKFFKMVVVHDSEERYLLKAAKELRLVLPKYLLRKST